MNSAPKSKPVTGVHQIHAGAQFLVVRNAEDIVERRLGKDWYRNLVIARAIADTLEVVNPPFPKAEAGLAQVTIPD
jgi:hypothetical protein